MPRQPEPSASQSLSQTLDILPGVGPKVLSKLKKLGLENLEEALYHLPLRYEDRRQLLSVGQLQDDGQQVFVATVLAAGENVTARQRRRLYEVIVGDSTGKISLKWFRYRKPWLQKRFPVGQKAVFIGEVKRYGAIREIHHPDSELISDSTDFERLQELDPFNYGRILPVYPLTDGITQKQMRKIWYSLVFRFATELAQTLPASICRKHKLQAIPEAVQQIHWPDQSADIEKLNRGRSRARESLVFDEFFYLELGLALRRSGVKLEQGIAFNVRHQYTIPLNKMLPFKLTDAQRRVLGEIKQDMMSPHPMHRLLQGDVGSGKTLVALMAALIAIENEAQVAIVAPTEILAEQHFRTFSAWLDKLGLKSCLLLGTMPGKQKKEFLEQIKSGEIDLVVGTHAVLQDQVEFKHLGLGVVDEQHRFGVRQRSLLKQKGDNPDILVMTATPIPRTLSMTLYGDLSVSVIDQLPPGRKPVTTKIIYPRYINKMYAQVKAEVEFGRQAYIVYPLVEDSEKLDLTAATEAAERLAAEVFPDYCIGLLHGRMKADEKDQIMEKFRQNQVQILVATTVIEVGVDVPNATTMIIEHADRFGLSQLHQLRGRVGRGAEKSHCFLVPSKEISDDARKRLQVMESTNDGFRIAEADLEIRGPGDFLGTRQSGFPDLRVANILKDQAILERARREAFEYVDDMTTSANRDRKEVDAVKKELERRWGGRLGLAMIG